MIKDIIIIILSLLISVFLAYGVIYCAKKFWRSLNKKSIPPSSPPPPATSGSFDISPKGFNEQKTNPYKE